ncbi:hypothetical protein HW932_09695 [Allochromatium humboldtianum]|uniref:DUF1640 domain-containing protein n=1 Tax=Allochromatium humboldtianum TaxID=504901 RepID=A0A850RB30_9GAMM|nr:hypothetical protein [Allochromatium humboldtianum]NVZ09536.1 hypothetical protein [Allochromatium humboldtianum]
MTTIVLDTLAYAEKLKSGGFSEQQAATQAHALAEIIDRQIATKGDVEARENNLRRDIEALRLEVKRDIAETNARIAESKAELIRWVVGAGFLQTTLIIGALMKMSGIV